MTTLPARDADVLVAGAGPTGLALALWLARLGVRVRIIDKLRAAGTTSRAVAVQARTLEFYQQVGLAQALVERGLKAVAANIWITGRKVAHAVLGEMGEGLSPFPYVLIFPQDEHERLLIDQLRTFGVEVERSTELLGFEQDSDRVVARLQRPDGSAESCDVAYVAGCDGAHSIVRQALAFGFPGGTYAHMFYVADVQASGAAMNGELHIGFDRSEFLAVFPMAGGSRARLVGTVRQDIDPQQALTWADVSQRVITWMNIDVKQVNWFSIYRVHHRVAEHFHQGRAFLLGDAAHIHSPVGGQGMNTGIGDAVNLAWKLADVVHGRASAALLDSYEPERLAFARRLVATTDRAFTAVTSSTVMARLIRLHLVPAALPLLLALKSIRRLMFRTVSQTTVNYRGTSLSEGQVGQVQGGDRLPWVALTAGDDNYAPLRSLSWQVHVYGNAAPAVSTLCAARALPLHVFAWRPAMGRCGFMRSAIYLVRPDGYVALASNDMSAAELANYLAKRGINLT